MQSMSRDLEDHLDSEDAGEDVIETVENCVALWALVYRILSSERYTTGTNDDHYEQVKVAQVHNEVTKTTQPA